MRWSHEVVPNEVGLDVGRACVENHAAGARQRRVNSDPPRQ
jgi:hypothetical protein